MSFFRNIAEAIVRKAGYQVPLDPKTSTAVQKGNGFSSLLSGKQDNQLVMPTPPTPPADAADVEAQRKYNEALLSYNQKFQTYQTRMMNVFFQRFLMMQQTIWQTRQAQSTSATNTGGVTSPIGSVGDIGSIIGKESIDV